MGHHEQHILCITSCLSSPQLPLFLFPLIIVSLDLNLPRKLSTLKSLPKALIFLKIQAKVDGIFHLHLAKIVAKRKDYKIPFYLHSELL